LFTEKLLEEKGGKTAREPAIVPLQYGFCENTSRENAVKDYVFATPARPADPERELLAAREIARASLTADSPAEVYRLAMERITPLVGAAFSCVFLRESGEELLKVVAAHEWPKQFRDYLHELRVRVGRGPTGQAVAENRVIEVEDIFADASVEDWWEVARELGFASSTSLPLTLRGEAIGAVTFYFREPAALGAADRNLLRLAADQLSAAAEKAHLINDLRRANRRLRDQNVELALRYREAEEARRLKREFLANISHELRTPLTAVLGYTYLLREALPGELSAEQGAAVVKIETAATSLMRLIDDLLQLMHLKLGRTMVELEMCDAVELTRAAVAANPARPPIEMRLELPSAPMPVYTDPGHVLRILGNLLSNALKFTEEGSVTVRLRLLPALQLVREEEVKGGQTPPQPRVLWEVEDTGIGIAVEEQERIFDEFRQVDGSATRKYGGTGLGLALSRGLARRLGGEITLRSVPGRGATFRLHLPASEPAAADLVPDPEAGATEPSTNPEPATERR
jgi:signal transduction histidine kinase